MINDLKDLKKLLQLCRAQGVTELDLNGIKVKLGELPQENTQRVADDSESETDNPYANFPDVVLTPEQLMFYSAGGLPENDPALEVSQ